MPLFVHQSLIPAPVARVFAFHESPGALERLLPPWERARVVLSGGSLQAGADVRLPPRRDAGGLRRLLISSEIMLNTLRRFSLFAGPTALVMLLLTSWKAPSLLGWWSAPPIQDRLSCAPTVEWAARTMLELQLLGLAFGLALGGVLAVVTRRKVTASLGPAATAALASAPASPAVDDKIDKIDKK